MRRGVLYIKKNIQNDLMNKDYPFLNIIYSLTPHLITQTKETIPEINITLLDKNDTNCILSGKTS